jgi:hypothetical protein
MRYSLAVFAAFAVTAIASPLLSTRQNDTPECEEGTGDPISQVWDSRKCIDAGSREDNADEMIVGDECVSKCILAEGADNGNKGGSCAGHCLAASRFGGSICRP